MPRRAEWLARGFMAVLAVSYTIRIFLPRWLREDRYEGDLSQHVWWTGRFADPERFPGDFIADFFSLPLFAPLGYQALYRAAVPLADPQTVAETIPLVLGPLLIALCWRAGRAAAGGSLAGALVGAAVGLRLLPYISAGLPRGFAMPLILLGLVGLLERRPWVLGLAALLSALFYPPLTVNLGLTAAVVLGAEWIRTRRMPAGWPALAVLGAVAALVLVRVYALPLPEDIGPKVSAEQARAMPEFGPDGRSAFFFESRLETYLGKGRGGLGLRTEQSLLLGSLIALSAWRLPGVVPLAAWALLGTGLLAWALAHGLLFALHLPSRYLLYALPAFVAIWLAALAPPLLGRLRARYPALARPAVLVAAGLAVLALTTQRNLESTWTRAHRPVNGHRVTTMDFLKTLPRDALIASHPGDANAIPLLTARSTLASMEVALPYYLGYYERMAERVEASLRAVYALDWSEVEALRERYGVDVLVLNRGRLHLENRRVDEPFASRLGDRLGAGDRSRYALWRPPRDRLLWRAGSWVVVRLGPPRPGYEPSPSVFPPRTSSPAAAGTR